MGKSCKGRRICVLFSVYLTIQAEVFMFIWPNPFWIKDPAVIFHHSFSVLITKHRHDPFQGYFKRWWFFCPQMDHWRRWGFVIGSAWLPLLGWNCYTHWQPWFGTLKLMGNLLILFGSSDWKSLSVFRQS